MATVVQLSGLEWSGAKRGKGAKEALFVLSGPLISEEPKCKVSRGETLQANQVTSALAVLHSRPRNASAVIVTSELRLPLVVRLLPFEKGAQFHLINCF